MYICDYILNLYVILFGVNREIFYAIPETIRVYTSDSYVEEDLTPEQSMKIQKSIHYIMNYKYLHRNLEDTI